MRSRFRWFHIATPVAVVVMSVLWPGCGSGAGKVGAQPSWRKPREVKPFVTKQPQRVSGANPVVFSPDGPAAEFYNDPPIAPAPSSPLADAIVAQIHAMYTSVQLTPPRPDGRLYAALSELATAVPEEGLLPYPLVEFALQRHGIIEPSPHLVIIWGPLDDPAPIVEQLRGRLTSIMSMGQATRIGVGTARRRGGQGVAILALQASHVETRPIPRALPTGGTFALEGRILGQYRQPEVYVTREDGRVEHLAGSKGLGFRVPISCAGQNGRQQVEITAEDALGSTVLANFPVWCNQPAPRSITLESSEDSSSVQTEAQAEALMLQLVNQDRARHNLGPLQPSAEAAEVARGHSREMRVTGVVAHVSPKTGSAADRVRAAGISTSMVLENIARAYGVTEAQAGLMNSPGHRANLLSEDATHLGIGIVFGEQEAGRRELFVTQVFIRKAKPISLEQARKQVVTEISARGGVASDPALNQLAQEYANAVVSGVSSAQASARLSEQLNPLASRFSKVTTTVTAVADIQAFDVQRALADPSVTHYGLGVARGAHQKLGDKALYLVLLLAQKR